MVVWVPQRSQAFKDASDAQVVVSVPVNEHKKRTNQITGFVGFFFALVMLNLFAHMFKFSNLSAQFSARLTSPVFSFFSRIP